jgi:uncharacterized tellurite resistance protein B-like protein
MTHALQAVAPDSPEAAACVLSLAIMADGRLQGTEVGALDKHQAYAKLGMSREQFYEVMRDVCTALLERQTASGRSMFHLDEEPAVGWIDALQSPALRQTVAELALAVIRSDGELHPGESRLYWRVLDRWGVTLDEVRTAQWAAAAAADPEPIRPNPAPRVYRLPASSLMVA